MSSLFGDTGRKWQRPWLTGLPEKWVLRRRGRVGIEFLTTVGAPVSPYSRRQRYERLLQQPCLHLLLARCVARGLGSFGNHWSVLAPTARNVGNNLSACYGGRLFR